MTKKILILTFFACFLCAYFSSQSRALSLPDGMTIETVLSPRQATSGNIVILNDDDEPVTVRIYQTDYMFYADGKSEFGRPGSAQRSNASWITYSPNQLVVPSHGSAEIFYQITAPNNPDLRGTYWSVIMVEPLSKSALEPPSLEEGKVKVGLQAVFRHAVQVVAHIGDTGTRAMEFVDRRLEVKDGKIFLILGAKNTGERWLVPTLYVDLYDGSGYKLGRFEGGKLRIYPGCSVRYSINLGALNPGKYSALVIADNGDEHVFGARYALEIK